MLRIRYQGRKTAFIYDVKRRDVPDTIARHVYVMFTRENVPNPQTGQDERREIPLSEVIAEWQEGTGYKWNDDLPAEQIPIPPKIRR